jgi:hypothetical protein
VSMAMKMAAELLREKRVDVVTERGLRARRRDRVL